MSCFGVGPFFKSRHRPTITTTEKILNLQNARSLPRRGVKANCESQGDDSEAGNPVEVNSGRGYTGDYVEGYPGDNVEDHSFPRCSRGKILSPKLVPITSSSRLESLPSELLFIIETNLPTHCIAALVLSSKTFYMRLGTSSFLQLGRINKRAYPRWYGLPVSSGRQGLLLLLERDTDELIFCYYCQKLHSPEWSTRSRPRGENRSFTHCLAPNVQEHTTYASSYPEFNYPNLYQCMKLHRAGKDTRHILAGLSRTIDDEPSQVKRQIVHTARIVNGNFVMKTVHNIPLTVTSILGISIPRRPKGNFDWIVCPTVYMTSGLWSPFKTYINNVIKHKLDMVCGCMIWECVCCSTEYEAHVDKSNTLIITVWEDMGELRHPSEEKWQIRHYTRHLPFRGDRDIGTVGTISRDFEEAAPERAPSSHSSAPTSEKEAELGFFGRLAIRLLAG